MLMLGQLEKGQGEERSNDRAAKDEAQATFPAETQDKLCPRNHQSQGFLGGLGPVANLSLGTQALSGPRGVTTTELGDTWVSLGSCSFHLW